MDPFVSKIWLILANLNLFYANIAKLYLRKIRWQTIQKQLVHIVLIEWLEI